MLAKFWKDDEVDDNEKFLREYHPSFFFAISIDYFSYILRKRWMGKADDLKVTDLDIDERDDDVRMYFCIHCHSLSRIWMLKINSKNNIISALKNRNIFPRKF
jgi:hypothetical protein